MKKILPMDQHSENYRKCAYCKEPFMTNHQLRKFCASKNGIPNYCKHKFKGLVQGARLTGENPILSHHQPMIPEPVLEVPQKAVYPSIPLEPIEEPKTEVPQPNTEVKAKNVEILNDLMIKGKPIELSFQQIDNAGFDIRVYDRLRKLPRCNLSFIEIGNYAIFWTHKNKLLITPITETLWI